MFTGARRQHQSVSVWPGYVDALSALLMVVIFVLLIFTFAQFLLSEILSGQESELESLHRQVEELAQMLGLEQRKNKTLASNVAELSTYINMLTGEKDALSARLSALQQTSEQDRAKIETQLLTIASLQEDIDALRRLREELEGRIGNLAAALSTKQSVAGALRDRSKALQAALADQKERTLLAQQDVDTQKIRIQALVAVVGQQEKALEDEERLSASARAEVALLNQRLAALRQQLAEIDRALAASETTRLEQAAEIKDLGKRLNIALARRVNELERYRSEFFGRLRELLGENPFVRIEGDRFVFQAELLFASGSAVLGDEGRTHLEKLAVTLRSLSDQIPADIDWILRIDGHTDRVPINTIAFASNWELSTARAVSVVRFLATQGIPSERMAATGFSKFHPLDPADTPAAYRKNRRIEIKLTSR